MRRRDFITLVGGGTVAWPLVTCFVQRQLPGIGVFPFPRGEG